MNSLPHPSFLVQVASPLECGLAGDRDQNTEGIVIQTSVERGDRDQNNSGTHVRRGTLRGIFGVLLSLRHARTETRPPKTGLSSNKMTTRTSGPKQDPIVTNHHFKTSLVFTLRHKKTQTPKS